MVKYVFVTEKGKVIVKDLRGEKKAYSYMEKYPEDMEIWGNPPKNIMKWLAEHKPNWLTNALIKADGKIIK
jgi:hypothetical protein